MTPEERQRTMDFILEQQARAEETMHRWEMERERDIPRLARVESAFVTLTEIAEIQSNRLDSHDQEFQSLLGQVDRHLGQIDQHLQQIHHHLQQMDQRLQQIIDRLN